MKAAGRKTGGTIFARVLVGAVFLVMSTSGAGMAAQKKTNAELIELAKNESAGLRRSACREPGREGTP